MEGTAANEKHAPPIASVITGNKSAICVFAEGQTEAWLFLLISSVKRVTQYIAGNFVPRKNPVCDNNFLILLIAVFLQIVI